MNGDFILLLIYILEAAILGAIAFIVRSKHSEFPDFKIGYHVKEAEADRESWEYANDIAGKLDGDQYLLVTYKSNGTVEDAEIIIP